MFVRFWLLVREGTKLMREGSAKRKNKIYKRYEPKWMEMSTYLSPNWPKTSVPNTSPMRFNANVFAWYTSREHTQSSWDTIVLRYQVLLNSWTSQSTHNRSSSTTSSSIKKTNIGNGVREGEREKKNMLKEKVIFIEKCQVTNETKSHAERANMPAKPGKQRNRVHNMRQNQIARNQWQCNFIGEFFFPVDRQIKVCPFTNRLLFSANSSNPFSFDMNQLLIRCICIPFFLSVEFCLHLKKSKAKKKNYLFLTRSPDNKPSPWSFLPRRSHGKSGLHLMIRRKQKALTKTNCLLVNFLTEVL